MAHEAGAAGHGPQAVGGEYGTGVAGAEGLHAAQLTEKVLIDAGQGQHSRHFHGPYQVLGS